MKYLGAEAPSIAAMGENLTTLHAKAVDMALQLGQAASTVYAGPLEMVTRRDFGTRYFNLFSMLVGFATIQLVGVVSHEMDAL